MATNPESTTTPGPPTAPAPTTAPASPDPTKSTPAVSRRPRPTLSCQPCRRKKLKCDRSLPCEQCKRTRRYNECTYDYRPEYSGDPHYDDSEQRNKYPRLGDSPTATSIGLPTRILAPAPGGGYVDGLQTIEDLQARVRRLENALDQSPQASSVSRYAFDHGSSRRRETHHPTGAFMVKATRSRYHGPSHEINIYNRVCASCYPSFVLAVDKMERTRSAI